VEQAFEEVLDPGHSKELIGNALEVMTEATLKIAQIVFSAASRYGIRILLLRPPDQAN
jgi:hypothetical protein